ncbi:alpha/beta hydrolase [Roseovarius sp.]|uniref:alpha/beta hydrolase n=1 Tax=Roseovarius sp. TaxID=1486281 RepID=UPI003BAD312D
MRRKRARWPLRVLAGLGLVAVLLWVLGPYEPVETETAFDRRVLAGGVDPYLQEQEARFDDIRPGNQKRVIWHGLEEVPTDLAIVYLHGFSASSEEIRPVPDNVAQALGANLVFTRFRGHGRDGEAMAEATAGDWIEDAAEALAIGRKVGREVIVIATSTGGTVAAVAAQDQGLMRDVKGIAFISPNFGLRAAGAPLLTLPGARYWVPLVAGRTRSFEPRNEGHAREWTTSYPMEAVMPLAVLVKHAAGLEYGAVTVPALFYYSAEDAVLDAGATDAVRAAWGGPVRHAVPALGPGVDPAAHVIAGDILSPGNTEAAVKLILDWVGGLP